MESYSRKKSCDEGTSIGTAQAAHYHSNTDTVLMDSVKPSDFEEHDGNKSLTSDFGAFLHCVKSNLGSGVLASADGFKNAGTLLGSIGTILIGIVCTHSTYTMVKCSEEMRVLIGEKTLGFEDALELTMKNCNNKIFQKLSGIAKSSAAFFVFFTYYGTTTVYILLISETLKQIVEHYMDISWSIRVYILMVSVPVFIFGMIRSLKILVPFSGLANLLLITGISIIFYFVLQNLPSIASRPAFASPQQFPLFVSTMLFGMEGFGTMIPIMSSMKNPQHFLGPIGVYNCSMMVIVSFFVFVGFFGYLKFGNAIQGSITLNLPNDIYSEIVKGLVALGILFTYGLQLSVAVEVIWSKIKCNLSKEMQNIGYYLTRALLILATILIAIALPNLAPIISLIGAVGLSTCGIFYPALMETAILVNKGFGKWNWLLWKNVFLMAFAILALISGTVASLMVIIQEYRY